MKRKTLVIIISSFVILIMLSGVIFLGITRMGGQALSNSAMAQETHNGDSPGDNENDNDYTYIPPTPVDGNKTDEAPSNELTDKQDEPFVPATELDLDPSSITVFVNKEYALPKDYKPEQLVTPKVIFNLITYDERTLMRPEAAEALEKLFDAAKQQGIILYGVSAYRSYERQYTIFTNNIAKKGKKYTLRYSAVPGTSEHQTGLSIDVSVKSQNFKLDDNFASSPEGKWLADNAYRYGYIIRYPKGNEDITGYAFEPWHIRYVGEDLANYLYTNELTLEEYYHYTPSSDFNFEAKYADIINYVPPVVTEIPALPSVSPSVTPTGTPAATKAPSQGEGTITGTPSDEETKPGNSTEEQGQPGEDTPVGDGQDDNTQQPEDDTPENNGGTQTPTPSVTAIPSAIPTPAVTPTVVPAPSV